MASVADRATSENNLTAEDVAAFAKLGIPAGLLALAGVERVTDVDARERYGIRFHGDVAGIAFPYVVAGKRVGVRVRRDSPERNSNGSLENKYLSAYGNRRHLYLPPDYEGLAADLTVPVLMVEAEKSALAAMAWSKRTSKRLLPIGCGGCWGWRGQIGIKTTANGDREPEKGPLPEFSLIAGHPVGVLLDANAISNPKVRAARESLVDELRKIGCKVLLLNLPALDGVNGPDDYIGLYGDLAFRDILDGKTVVDAAVDLLVQPLSDYGNAQRLIQMKGDDLRYCTPMKKWLIWVGTRWVIDEMDQIHRIMQDVLIEFARQATLSGNDAISRFAGSCLNSNRVLSAIREAQPRLIVSPDQLDVNGWLLNFKNGTVDLRSGDLREHQRDDLITKIVHSDYESGAKCKTFLAFIERSVGANLVPYLQKALGYSATGITSEKKAFLCLGPTNSGKTTLLALLRDLLEEYSTVIQIDCLMARDEDNNTRADLADLRGVRFAMTSETEEGQWLRESKLKRVTQGQGKIKSVRKYENPITFPETHKLWLDANHKPIIRGVDDAIWGRLVPIPFDRPLDSSEIDPTLPSKLRAEAPGVLAWLVEGALSWKRHGLSQPPEVESARVAWRMEMDRIAAFLENNCIAGPNSSVQARVLYKAYNTYASEGGERPMNETLFGLRMKEAGIKKERNSTGRMVYLGVELKNVFNG